jgi:hypothetical protein
MERKPLIQKSSTVVVAHGVIALFGLGLAGYFGYEITVSQEWYTYTILIIACLLGILYSIAFLREILKPKILAEYDENNLYIIKRNGKDIALAWEQLSCAGRGSQDLSAADCLDEGRLRPAEKTS